MATIKNLHIKNQKNICKKKEMEHSDDQRKDRYTFKSRMVCEFPKIKKSILKLRQTTFVK